MIISGGMRLPQNFLKMKPLLPCHSVLKMVLKDTVRISTVMACLYNHGPVVQSIVSLTSSLRGQLVKCFMTLLPNTLLFFVDKMREAFAVQKLLLFFHQKILAYLRY